MSRAVPPPRRSEGDRLAAKGQRDAQRCPTPADHGRLGSRGSPLATGEIDTGKVASLAELAERHNVNRSYVSQIINLADLVPDIVQAILRGDEPDGISLEKLRKNLPVRWQEQRTRWRIGR